MRVRLALHAHHQTTDGTVMVCDTTRAVVHTVRGPHADALRVVLDADHDGRRPEGIDLPDHLDAAVVADLVAAGVLTAVTPMPASTRDSTREWDRRRALAVGAGAVAGIVTLALPTAAHAASVALPAAPTGDEYLGVDPYTRTFIVYWEPIPAPFTYTWSVFNTTSGKVLLATGSASASYFETAVYTYPLGISHLRLEVVSVTNPTASDALNHTV